MTLLSKSIDNNTGILPPNLKKNLRKSQPCQSTFFFFCKLYASSMELNRLKYLHPFLLFCIILKSLHFAILVGSDLQKDSGFGHEFAKISGEGNKLDIVSSSGFERKI
jgi:hypothetical protein